MIVTIVVTARAVVRDLSEISRREGVGILNLGSEMR